MGAPYLIRDGDPADRFPDVALALREPDGLLAVGGDLSPERIVAAYRRGIFPWYSAGQPILWWSPDPRAVLFPGQIRISRSLAKTLRKGSFTVTADREFQRVMELCAAPRRGESGTWITPEMQRSYLQLHDMGIAHSVECWSGGDVVGGLYGLAIGQVFFGESMFTRQRDASKVALVHLVERLRGWGYGLIDCQVVTAHLTSLGAVAIPRSRFISLLARLCDRPGREGRWDQ
ncbi:MAG TPA: leucyl/phenylalanyl-tRNA--protein transferase [Gammaproteobacteria bacterium]|nr:leucyl/phenylalanyl-tRNA--protein transferase [Gammaproteobacteria bacterium]